MTLIKLRQSALTDQLLDDIWECAAYFRDDAQYKHDMYEKYQERAYRYGVDVATAERVLDWVTAVKKERGIDDR